MSNAHLDPTEREILLQQYLDGDLAGVQATRLFLAAEEDAELRTELEAWRDLYAALDAAPREEPAPGFDSRVLARVPYGRYLSAPRRPRPVLILGEAAPAVLARALRPLRNGLTAMGLAWVLFLVVSHSFLQHAAAGAARSLGDTLAAWAQACADVPVLSFLVGGAARVYDALMGAVAALGDAIGGPTVTILLGLFLGASVLAALQVGRRRQEAKRTHA
jgi:hypothetical protein